MPSGFYQAQVNRDGHVCDTLHHLNDFDLTVLNCYGGQKAMVTAKGQDWVETMSKADLLAPYGSRVLFPKGKKFLIGSEVTACLWPTGDRDRVMMCTHSFTLEKASQEPRPEVEATPEPLRRADQCEERPSSLKRKTIAKVPGKNSSAKRLKVAHESSKPAAAAQSSNSIADGLYVVRASAAFCHVNIVTDTQSGNRHGFVRLNNGTSKDVIVSGFEWVEDHRVQETCWAGPPLTILQQGLMKWAILS
ncbi:hypothetical protein FOZ60_013221 [Perkinsus olseni]|uniref:Uncharacterized protein n=1 Tax=Perkinsus olseni TaxID=32597 RepID=A0A7J6NCH5_PEROL|nr:hypothetical protein FOZ60_013221 [Perkinsus olseni]